MSTHTETYVDGFVLPVPKANLDAYKKMAAASAVIWKEHGALDYKECVLEDARIEGVYSFLDLTGVKEDETVVFAFIVYKSRAHRDEVNAKVMADPRMDEICPARNPDAVMPFDCSKMAMGGFQTLVSA